jgi:hypothetical protein
MTHRAQLHKKYYTTSTDWRFESDEVRYEGMKMTRFFPIRFLCFIAMIITGITNIVANTAFEQSIQNQQIVCPAGRIDEKVTKTPESLGRPAFLSLWPIRASIRPDMRNNPVTILAQTTSFQSNEEETAVRTRIKPIAIVLFAAGGTSLIGAATFLLQAHFTEEAMMATARRNAGIGFIALGALCAASGLAVSLE